MYHHQRDGIERATPSPQESHGGEEKMRPGNWLGSVLCPPLPTNRHRLCNDDCLDGKKENYQTFCFVQYSVPSVQQLCTAVQCTHIWTDLRVVCWLDLAFLWLYCVLQFNCVRLSFFGLFCVVVLLCMCAFVMLDLVSSVLCQEIGWEEWLRNDLFCVEWDIKPQLSQSVLWHCWLDGSKGIHAIKNPCHLLQRLSFSSSRGRKP